MPKVGDEFADSGDGDGGRAMFKHTSLCVCIGSHKLRDPKTVRKESVRCNRNFVIQFTEMRYIK